MGESHKDFLSVLGYCFLQHGRFGDARTVFEALALLFPDDIRSRASLAYVQLRLNQPGLALDATDALLRLPLDARDRGFVRVIRGRALLALGRLDEARLASADVQSIGHEP